MTRKLREDWQEKLDIEAQELAKQEAAQRHKGRQAADYLVSQHARVHTSLSSSVVPIAAQPQSVSKRKSFAGRIEFESFAGSRYAAELLKAPITASAKIPFYRSQMSSTLLLSHRPSSTSNAGTVGRSPRTTRSLAQKHLPVGTNWHRIRTTNMQCGADWPMRLKKSASARPRCYQRRLFKVTCLTRINIAQDQRVLYAVQTRSFRRAMPHSVSQVEQPQTRQFFRLR